VKFKVGLGWATLGLSLVGCNGGPKASDPAATTKSLPPLSKLITTDTKVGTGPVAAVGDTVVMEYKGTLPDGKVFDSNVPADPGKPDKAPLNFQLTAGKASVIDGWNQGIPGMKVGGERRISIPWTLAYGEAGKPPIPPRTDLYFDVKLLGIVKQGQDGNYGVEDVKKGAGPVAKAGDWVTISYKSELLNGKLVDDSSSRPDGTLQFRVESGDMGGGEFVAVKGVAYGVAGMQAGGERLLTCPPALAVNPTAPPKEGIPMGSVVRFDVKMLRVLDKKGPPMKAPL
jgi:FKBP-type peptidyl-prolyl cis-trans isomerase